MLSRTVTKLCCAAMNLEYEGDIDALILPRKSILKL
jgi:hypothetical protein